MDSYGAQNQDRRRTAVIGVTIVVVFTLAVVAVWTVTALTGRTPAKGARAGDGQLRVVATIPPLAWPVRQLTPHAEVTVLMSPGASPHGMELTAGAARALAEADVVLAVGLGLDDAVIRALEDKPREGRELVLLEECLDVAGVSTPDEQDAEGDAASKAGKPNDPHAWLDPMVMSVFVGRVDSALGRASGGMSSGRLMLQDRCESIDANYRLALSAAPRATIVCEHNAYGYLARRYGLTVAAVLNPMGTGDVTPGDVKSVMDAIRTYHVGAIFIDPQTSASVAERIASEAGVTVLTLDPLGDGDWPKLMNDNLQALIDGLSVPAPVSRGSDDDDG